MKRILLFLTCVLTLFGVVRAKEYTDVISKASFNNYPSSYTSNPGSFTSSNGITYLVAGTASGNNMQWNSGGSKGGLVVTGNKNSYKLKSITIQFADNNTNSVQFYSNSSAYTYTQYTDFKSTLAGTQDGTLSKENNSKSFTDGPLYWGLNSPKNAIYITSITAVWEGDDNQGGEVVPTPGGEDQWVLINNVNDLEEGAQYIIAHLNGSSYYAMNTTVTSNKIQSDEVNVSDNLLTPVETTAIFELVADSNEKWKLKCTNNNNFLNVNSGSGTNLNFNTTGTANTIQFEGNYVLIDNTRRVFPNTDNGYGSYATSNWGSSGYIKPSLYKKQVSDTPIEPDPNKTPVTLSYDENTYTATKGKAFNAPKLNVTPEEAANAVSYKTDNGNVATVDANGAVTIKELGKTTVKAEISDNETYANASASYTLNVIKDGEYTVAEALTAIKNGYEGKAQVKGIITSIEEISEQYKNATYNISDDVTGSNSLKVYRGQWLEGANFNGNEIQVGGTIVVEGNLTNYNGTLEVGTGNVVISYTPPVAQDFTGFDKYVEEEIELEVGDEFTLDLGDKYPAITYNFEEEGVISITDNKVKALSVGIVEVTATWNADDNWTAGSAEFIVNVSAAQLGEIIATVSDGTELVNDGEITISEGTTITFTAKNAKQIVLITVDDNVEDAEVNGDTLVWTPSLCEDEVVMVEAYMDPENKTSSATSYFEFTLTVTEKQYEKGTEQNPYTVTEFNKNFSSLSGKVWVTGYIAGSMVSNSPVFGKADNHANTNLVFSEDADVSSSSLYIPVELPDGSVRTALNVKENAENIGRKVMLYGSAQTYFGLNGLKAVTDYKFFDEETPDAKPELSFKFEGQTVTEPIELGWDATVFPTLVTPEDAEFDVTYTSSDTTVAEIDNEGNITLKGVAGETVITAETAAIEGQYAEGSASYTLVIVDPNSVKGMFDFTVKNPYGMTTTSDGNTYQSGSTTANEKDVTLFVDGRYRSWGSKDPYDLRVYSSNGGCSLTFSVPAGYKLETIEFTGSSLNNLSAGSGKYENIVWEAGDEIINSVTFTASGTANISTIDVYYTPYIELSPGEADDQQSGVFENGTYKIVSVQDVARVFFLNTPEGKVPYYRVEYDGIPDPGANEGDNGETEQLPSSKPSIRRANTEGWTAAKVYTYELNNGDYFGELNNESSGTIYVKYVDEDGSNETKPVSYAFVVDRNNPTGVESVVVGEGEVIYFDLNGRRVANPEKGIFIKVEADKVSKVIL